LSGRDDDSYDDDIPDDSSEYDNPAWDLPSDQFFENQFGAIGYELDFSELDEHDLNIAFDIVANHIQDGHYPDIEAMERLADLTGLDYDYWEELFEYYEDVYDLEAYTED
jgi:hypothetical protein